MSTIEIDKAQRFPSVLNVRRGTELRRYLPERTCRMGAPIDGEYRCGECSHLSRETYRPDKGWYAPEYCPHCGARVVSA